MRPKAVPWPHAELAFCRGGGALLSGGMPKPLMPPDTSGTKRLLQCKERNKFLECYGCFENLQKLWGLQEGIASQLLWVLEFQKVIDMSIENANQ